MWVRLGVGMVQGIRGGGESAVGAARGMRGLISLGKFGLGGFVINIDDWIDNMCGHIHSQEYEIKLERKKSGLLRELCILLLGGSLNHV